MKRTKTNPFDWALIQWARLCEESKIVDPTKVEPTLDPEKDDMGRLSDPLAWLASRAKKTLASLGLDGARWLDRSVSVWFASALFVVALGALVFPIPSRLSSSFSVSFSFSRFRSYCSLS